MLYFTCQKQLNAPFHMLGKHNNKHLYNLARNSCLKHFENTRTRQQKMIQTVHAFLNTLVTKGHANADKSEKTLIRNRMNARRTTTSHIF